MFWFWVKCQETLVTNCHYNLPNETNPMWWHLIRMSTIHTIFGRVWGWACAAHPIQISRKRIALYIYWTHIYYYINEAYHQVASGPHCKCAPSAPRKRKKIQYPPQSRFMLRWYKSSRQWERDYILETVWRTHFWWRLIIIVHWYTYYLK